MQNAYVVSFSAIILLSLVLTLPSVFADTWYVGKGLKQGDYFRYNVCYFYYHNCTPLEIDFWVQNQSSTSHDYFLQMLVIDGNKTQKGTVMTTSDLDPVYSDPNISDYSDVYKNTIIQLGNIASSKSPKDFDSPSWYHIGVMGGVGPIAQEQVTVKAGTFDTWIIGWHKGVDNKIWVVPSMPFPVKAVTWVDCTCGRPPPDYRFELLETGNSQTFPPQFFKSDLSPHRDSALPCPPPPKIPVTCSPSDGSCFRPDIAISQITSNKCLGLFTKLTSSENSTDKDLYLRFFNVDTNQTTNNVSFFINVTKQDKILEHDLFFTHSGIFTIKFQPNVSGNMTSLSEQDPVLGGWTSANDTIAIHPSIFTNVGLYHIRIEILAVNYTIVNQNNTPKFDSWWSIDDKGNILKYDNNTTVNSLDIGKRPIVNKIQSPLKQFKTGITWNNIQCVTGLELIIKTGNNSPVCVKPQTSEKLIERRWAESLASFLESPIKKMDIIGLDGNYKVGQPINATVEYAGYESGGVYPDVKILDMSNGNKIWSNCVYAHSQTATKFYYANTYNVQCFNAYPVINDTGAYAMVASLDNKTVEARFNVIS